MTEQQELLPIARTGGAYGVRGWVRIVPFELGEPLFATKTWHFIAMNGAQRILSVQELKEHGTQLIAKFEGIDSKEDADRLRGRIALLREDFPELEEDDEHWAVDIIGCRVVNLEGEELGVVADISDNSVQDILVVRGKRGNEPLEYLIPVVEQYVEEIDTEGRVIRVDWHSDWL
ncbi:MAG: 16S rRNA processing protein RimM [Duodenibacillus sp.]|nr:16S rRNA processing protein RimM [Duodenibacillus sp.]HBC69775.1 16S rRNA processing protein RimM [Sutterella sp.]